MKKINFNRSRMVMTPWATILSDSLRTGAVATFATTVAATACGTSEGTTAAAPINAISHILWGDRAAAQNEVSTKYTLAGLTLNAAAVGSWAGIFEVAFGKRAKQGDAAAALLGGAAVSALAYVTDYHIVPSRLTPGFEKRLSGKSMFKIYTVLALSLGLGGLCTDGRPARR